MQLKCKEDLSIVTETFKEDKMTDTLFLEPAKIDTSIQTYDKITQSLCFISLSNIYIPPICK